jgi:hypothetical protein
MNSKSKTVKLVLAAMVTLILLALRPDVCRAAYIIDAGLSDWGVTPFSDWVPSGTADHVVRNGNNTYSASGYGQYYDFEALYFDDDINNFYFAGVCSYPVGTSTNGGDLGIDLNGDATISTHGIVSGLEYAIRVSSATQGQVIANPVWSNTTYKQWIDGWQGSPWRAVGGTVIGSATVNVQYYSSMESGTYIFEIAASRDLFNSVMEYDDPVTCHMAMWCANDSINLTADINEATPLSLYTRCDRSDANLVLADDYQCADSGLVTNVLLWGAWKNDVKGQIKKIHLSIHQDIPDDPNDPCDYSKPGIKVWDGNFTEADFVESYVGIDPNNGWFWDPNNDQNATIAGYTGIWQYEIFIDPYYAFMHQCDPCNPTVYWLDAYVELEPDPNEEHEFYWKDTSKHWNDDAVWSEDNGAIWNEMRYPPNHPYESNSVDLAFVIHTKDLPLAHQKWSQPPIEIDPNAYLPVYYGWDEESRYHGQESIWYPGWQCPTQCHADADCSGTVDEDDYQIVLDAWLSESQDLNSPYDANADFNRDLDVDHADLDIMTRWWYEEIPAPPNDCPNEPQLQSSWKLVADDFKCLGGMPVTAVRWWGSHIGWTGMEPPIDAAPQVWRIGFWSSTPDPQPLNPATFSAPGQLLWQIQADSNQVAINTVGDDNSPDPNRPSDTCFQYYLSLEPNEVFWQQDHNDSTTEDIFWLSIAAVYPDDGQVEFPWGWKTRPQHWRYDAVTFDVIGQLDLGTLADNVTPLEHEGESFDVAFELDTDPNWIKWEQPFVDIWRGLDYWDIGFRGWQHYHDEESMATEIIPQDPNIERLVADDWQCTDTTPVAAIVWWGSYIGYRYDPRNPQTMPAPAGPKYFRLSMWDDVPAGTDPCGFSHPNDSLWTYDANASDYVEVMVGYDKEPNDQNGPPREPVYRYSVAIPDSNRFIQTGQEDIYWLSIVAVYDPNIVGDDNSVLIDDMESYNTTDNRIYYTWDDRYVNDTGSEVALGTRQSGDPVLGGQQSMEYIYDNQDSDGWGLEYYSEISRTFDEPQDWAATGTSVLALWFYGAPDNDANATEQMYVGLEDSTGAGSYGQVNYAGDMNDIKKQQWQQWCIDLASFATVDLTQVKKIYIGFGIRGNPNPGGIPGGKGTVYFDDIALHTQCPAQYGYDWGWTNRKHMFNDDAVAGHLNDQGQWVWTELYDQTGASQDMSFVLFTEPCLPEDLDFGDAPDPNYPTLLDSNGARHVIGGPFFCDFGGDDEPDAETDGQPTPLANGDDLLDGNDDEDGVVFPPLVQDQPGLVDVNVCGGGGIVEIWIDYNGDGDWDDPCEFVFDEYRADGFHAIPVTPPGTSVVGMTFARCRISTTGGLLPTGQADDGEVEDHTVVIEEGLVPTCWDNITQCAGQGSGDGTCDGQVNLADLFALKAHFGKCAPWLPTECCSDYNQSGCINLADLFILKAGFGTFGYVPSTGNQNCP